MELPANFKTLPRHVLLLLLAGLLLRIAFISAHQRPLISDEREYHRLAATLSVNGEYTIDGVPTAYRPIAYPAFVALVYSIAGEHPVLVKILQGFIDILTALILYFILGQGASKFQTAALTIWCFYLPAILYTNLLVTETLYTFVFVASCYLVVRYRLETSLSAILIGTLLGFLVLIKSGMVLFILVFPLIMYFSGIPLVRYKYIAIGAIIVLTPWLVRNYIELGKPTLSTSGGINLLIGNNPNANGSYTVNFPPEVFAEATNEIEADEAAYGYAVQYIMVHPGRFNFNGFKKIAHFVSSEGGLLAWSFHDNPEDFSERFAEKYASVPLFYTIPVNIVYMATLLLGILGFLLAKKDLLWIFVSSFAVCLLVTHVVFFGGSRYHFPLMPFAALYAAPVALRFQEHFKKLSKTKKTLFLVIAAGLLTVWVSEFIILYNA